MTTRSGTGGGTTSAGTVPVVGKGRQTSGRALKKILVAWFLLHAFQNQTVAKLFAAAVGTTGQASPDGGLGAANAGIVVLGVLFGRFRGILHRSHKRQPGGR